MQNTIIFGKKPKAQTVGTIEEEKLELEGIQENELSQKPDQEASKTEFKESIMFENLKNGSFFYILSSYNNAEDPPKTFPFIYSLS